MRLLKMHMSFLKKIWPKLVEIDQGYSYHCTVKKDLETKSSTYVFILVQQSGNTGLTSKERKSFSHFTPCDMVFLSDLLHQLVFFVFLLSLIFFIYNLGFYTRIDCTTITCLYIFFRKSRLLELL